MAKTFFSRRDIEALAERMDARAWSPLIVDMPELQKDVRCAAAMIRYMLANNVPLSHLELDIWNGTI